MKVCFGDVSPLIYLPLPDSPYRHFLSEAVLRLQEQGKLTALKIKWWKEKRGGGACSVSPSWSRVSEEVLISRFGSSQASSDDGGAVALELANVGGVFLLLVMGAFVGILINILQFVLFIKSQADENNVSERLGFGKLFR